MLRQRTIGTLVTSSGIGVHSGKNCKISFAPAPVDTGVVFCRKDIAGNPEILANAEYVNDTQMCTAMEKDGVRVATVEHLMSALAGLGIDNIRIELDSPEVPIMDGSSAPFVYLLQQAGIVEQDAAKRFICVNQEIEIREGDKFAKLLPFDACRFDFTIFFNHPVLRRGSNFFRLDFSSLRYVREIARARTFGFLRDIEFLQSNNLGLGGGLDNAVVVDDYRILNEQGLRFPDEFVRHKLLDAVRDLYMLGAPLLGWYQGYKSGHDLNNKLCRKLLAERDKWSYKQLDTLNSSISYGAE